MQQRVELAVELALHRGELCSAAVQPVVQRSSKSPPPTCGLFQIYFSATVFCLISFSSWPEGLRSGFHSAQSSPRRSSWRATESDRATPWHQMSCRSCLALSDVHTRAHTASFYLALTHVQNVGAYGQPRIHTGARHPFGKRQCSRASLGSLPRIYPCHLCSYSVVYLESRKFRRGELPPYPQIPSPAFSIFQSVRRFSCPYRAFSRAGAAGCAAGWTAVHGE